ncbi:cytochrome c oxidase assembly protein [Caballeronia sp. LP006]|uniref:cytochrome c oxidase assembly protein n=1 Tax=Caballeronia sp. LP006 TaxID=3038552 RepID=UPI002864C351|nr:cytochrome c oxidase assembly protein [Caballeronia sp. LP006]MDR5826738.1 cytochrome c oxidase assembly protein [Caballeronia sp. LP006]
MSLISLLEPWEPSYALVAVLIVVAGLFARGARKARMSVARRIAFWTGLVLFYVALHTKVDYYAEHQFFVHRLQHLVLHHLAPLVLMASYPGAALRAGLPFAWRPLLRNWQRSRGARLLGAVLLNPTVIGMAFIVSVLVWLLPSIQFVSMLDWRIYRFMNWSVAISGLMYWWMILDHRPSPPSRTRPGLRVLSPVITMTPQILAGALITFSSRDLYPVFEVCGRAFTSVPPALDQSLGGLIMWVPAAVLETVGAMMALRLMMRLSNSPREKARQVSRRRSARQDRVHPVTR